MTILFLVLVVICAAVLGFIILVQNPKGGGLQGSVGGFGNQFMGVKQTTDVLEKGTWIFAGAIAVLCLISTLFFSSVKSSSIDQRNFGNTPAPKAQTPTNKLTDTTKKP